LHDKLNEPNFISYIKSYDIVILSECWIDKSFDDIIDGYICKPVPLLKSKHKQGGGLFLLIKNCFVKYIERVEILNDTIIWLKIAKDITTCGVDYYIGCVYLPPVNSKYYKMYNCDLFFDLVNSVEKFASDTAKVFLLGDMNARTAIGNDFIENDNICGPIFDSFNHIFGYMSDNNLPVRRNPDQGTNEFGLKLLNLCRATGLRILNGRHEDGLADDYTFCGSRGMSVVDYLLAPYDYFHVVEQFIVGNFTSFSDHAPLHVRLQCILQNPHARVSSGGTSSNTYDSYRWNEDLKEQCYESLTLNSGLLGQLVFSDFEKSQGGIDNYVESFTSQLMDVVDPFLDFTRYTRSYSW